MRYPLRGSFLVSASHGVREGEPHRDLRHVDAPIGGMLPGHLCIPVLADTRVVHRVIERTEPFRRLFEWDEDHVLRYRVGAVQIEQGVPE